MVCPKCGYQMHQYKETGSGYSGEMEYETWEIKQCPHCSQLAIEFYATALIDSPDAKPIFNLTYNGNTNL